VRRMGPQHLTKRTRWPAACASESGHLQTLVLQHGIGATNGLGRFVSPTAKIPRAIRIASSFQ
jgi:hypothetical protein